MDFKKELNDRINYIEEIINNNLIDENSKKDDLQYQIYEAMNYSVMSGGKRLRPMFMMESYRLFKGEDLSKIAPFMADTFPFMTAIELIHTYSLVHDDLEAMDNDEYRRGKKTTHAVYGEAMGVLCGDALLNYAFEIGLDGIKKASDKNLAIDSLSILSEKAGVFITACKAQQSPHTLFFQKKHIVYSSIVLNRIVRVRRQIVHASSDIYRICKGSSHL